MGVDSTDKLKKACNRQFQIDKMAKLTAHVQADTILSESDLIGRDEVMSGQVRSGCVSHMRSGVHIAENVEKKVNGY